MQKCQRSMRTGVGVHRHFARSLQALKHGAQKEQKKIRQACAPEIELDLT